MLIEGFVLGLAYVLSPGPVTVETVRRSLMGGWRPALAIQLGAVLGDLLYALLAIVGNGAFLLQHEIRLGLGLLGAGLLIMLGVSAIRDGQRIGRQFAEAGSGAAPQRAGLQRHFGAGILLALANPYAIVFWLSVGAALNGSLIGLTGFGLGSLLGSVGTALVAGQLQGQRAQRLARWIWSGCGGLLLVLGANLGYSMLVVR